MKNRWFPALLWAGVAALCLALPTTASAALGEKHSASVASSASPLRIKATSRHGAYTIEETQTDSGTLREYVSPSGAVFAVAWTGLSHPDLSEVLGSYYPEYQKKFERLRSIPVRPEQARDRIRALSSLETPHLKIRKWGHMRRLHGVALAPALFPSGVSENEVQ